jgi:[acyl-carrier-protein] S-malonyltransferase
VLVIVAPGQGAQTPGFLQPWLEDPAFATRLDWLSAVAGLDLAHYGTEADADTIRDTRIAQPLLVATGLVAALDLFPHPADAFARIGAVAGHSVGEITVAAGARAISAEQAMVLVRERGRAMATAAAAEPTGMSAVMGGDPDEVAAALKKHDLVAANVNGAGQVVAAGRIDDLVALAAAPPARARVIPLKVAGAFHTEFMGSAVDVLAKHARAVYTHDPRVRLVSNADGTVVHDGQEVLRRLVSQVRNPVRWDLCMEAFRDLGVTGLIEIPPAGALANLAKRALPGVEILALKTPDDLPAARELIREHGTPGPLSAAPSWRLVVSPTKGMIRKVDLDAGTKIRSGSTVATVDGRREQHPVLAAHDGTVVEWLVEEGDPVSPGQPLLRMQPVVNS